ncbi:MAG TPA: hypothetical protein VKN18_10580 [Blastocatellia bacterium]|nr:hypothetical protein [Blastocatellia bacterium]
MLVYALTKFVAYCMWCLLGLRLHDPAQATFRRALKFGALRWLLGLAFGVMAAIALGSVSSESVVRLYFGVYVPLRVVEWSIMVFLIHRAVCGQPSSSRSAMIWLWVLGGIGVSFATDLASPEGMAGRFCVGRCLC